MINKIKNGEILVIDNFFSINDCQEITTTKIFKKNENPNAQGRVCPLTGDEKTSLKTKIEATLGTSIDVHFIARIRVTNRSDKNQGSSFVHHDPFPLAGIAYLSPNPEKAKNCGTSFYQHVLNRKKFVDYNNELEKLKWSIILENHSKQLSFWQQWKHVDYQIGRMVFFNGGFLHAGPIESFGENDGSGRITLEIFATP